MAEYIVISVPDDKDLACFNCERDTCIEVGCPNAPSAITARPKERIVRCKDCKYQRDCYCDHPKGAYMNAILPVELDGFCAWGEVR